MGAWGFSCVVFIVMLMATPKLYAQVLSVDSSLIASSAPSIVRVPKMVVHDIYHEDFYFYRLLQLALTKSSAEFGSYELEQFPFIIADKRQVSELLQGSIDVIWRTTNSDYEAEFMPIKISLLKNLTDYRLLLIRKGEQAKFSAVKNLADLGQLRGGIHTQWPDYALMKANGLTLVGATVYPKLFKMLAAGRFDYFSRGIYQIQPEATLHAEQHLVIEQELMLYYPNSIYFFVRKGQDALARRIEQGLMLALADGSFDELLNSIPHYRWATDALHEHTRRVITLAQPAH